MNALFHFRRWLVTDCRWVEGWMGSAVCNLVPIHPFFFLSLSFMFREYCIVGIGINTKLPNEGIIDTDFDSIRSTNEHKGRGYGC